MNIKNSSIVSLLIVSSSYGFFFGQNSFADDSFGKKHPRRAQVVNREKRQQNKNNTAAVNGKITDKQAQHLDKEDQRIHNQEKQDAANNGGHITKSEQNHLNREENGVTRQRNSDEQKDASTPNASNGQ